ncbi:MAG: glycosyltransferase [Parvibaculaceae bacterium]|nr:glycosyltransferase [Parvibaculaceae bacterium]
MREIWIVAKWFPPINTIGAERPKKLMNYFRSKGDLTTIFTIARPSGAEADLLLPDVAVRRSNVLVSEYLFRDEQKGFGSRLKILAAQIVSTLFDDSGWLWMLGLRSDLKKEICNRRPDLIIATGRPFLTFFVVAAFCKKNRIPFILDYRDAWANNPHATYNTRIRRKMISWMERKLNLKADAITTVSQMTAASLGSAKKPLVVYNFPDANYANEVIDSAREAPAFDRHKLTLAFAGTLYPGRDFDPICEALKSLPVEIQEGIEVHYCGNSAHRALSSFRKFGLEQIIKNHGQLSKKESMRLVAGCDIALSIIASDNFEPSDALQGVISTKIFDYLLLGKEVLNLIPDGFEFRELAESVKMQNVSSFCPTDLDGVRTYLEKKTRENFSKKSSTQAAMTLVGQWEQQMRVLDDTIESIIR